MYIQQKVQNFYKHYIKIKVYITNMLEKVFFKTKGGGLVYKKYAKYLTYTIN